MTILLMFNSLADCEQACSEVNPFYYYPPLSLRWSNPTDMEFTGGRFAIEKPTNTESIAAITPPYTEIAYTEVESERVYQQGDY